MRRQIIFLLTAFMIMTHPIDIYNTAELNNGQTCSVIVNDGNDASVNGLGKDSNGDYYSYMKLENGTAEIDVYSNKTVINEDLNVNGKLDTPNKTTAASALGSDLQKAIIDLVYPIGSYYITQTAGFDPNVSFGGSWTRVLSRFLYATSNDSLLGTEGGDVNHQHQYGIAHSAWYGNVSGYGGDAMRILNNGSWTDIASHGTLTVGTPNGRQNIGGVQALYNSYNTTSNGSLPPWRRVAVWYRTA